MIRKLLLSAAVVFALTSSVMASPEGLLSELGIEASADLNYSSIYMWRGIMLDGDPVVQPGFYLRSPESKLGRVKFGFWMSRDMDNRDNLKSAENDYIFDYTYNFKCVDASFGHTYYDFPDVLPADGAPKGWSREFYGGLALPKLFLSPSVFYYYDYGKKEEGGGEGSYTVINAAHSIPFVVKGLNLSLDTAAHAGFNNKLYFRGHGGDFGISTGVTVPLTKELSLKPCVSYSLPWQNMHDKDIGNQKSRVYTGAYLSASF